MDLGGKPSVKITKNGGFIPYKRPDAPASFTKVQRDNVTRSHLPTLKQDLEKLQKSDAAHSDFSLIGKLRKTLDDLEATVKGNEMHAHVQQTLEKQGQLDELKMFDMYSHKNVWDATMREFDAAHDAKEDAVIRRYDRRLRKFDANLASGQWTPVAMPKTPKLPSVGLAMKSELDKYAMVPGHSVDSLRKAASLQKELFQYEYEAQHDFDAQQQRQADEERQNVYIERDTELLRLQKRRLDQRQLMLKDLKKRAKLLSLKHSNYQKTLAHDHAIGCQTNVQKGVTPKRPFPALQPPKQLLKLHRPATTNEYGLAASQSLKNTGLLSSMHMPNFPSLPMSPLPSREGQGEATMTMRTLRDNGRKSFSAVLNSPYPKTCPHTCPPVVGPRQVITPSLELYFGGERGGKPPLQWRQQRDNNRERMQRASSPFITESMHGM